jgi:hypothetical protein
VNALLGNWSVLKSNRIKFKSCIGEVRKLLSRLDLKDTFDPAFWKRLSFFALIKPDKVILPVRTVYNDRTKNIGLNYLTSKKPIWYAGPDLVAAKLLRGEAPHILKAIRMHASGQQKYLRSTKLARTVRIDPKKDDFFVRVIEERNRLKRIDRPVSDFLKVVGNSGSYGLFVQVDPDTLQKSKKIRIYAGEKTLSQTSRYIEKPGPWYFPPIASLITSGGRLLLAMLERSVLDSRGSYLFCDTDSMCIVGSERGELVPCVGGDHKLDGRDAIWALSFRQIKSIARKFNRLNPYHPKYVRNILKIEDVNHVDGNPDKPLRRVLGYAIAAKRYALYTQTKRNISLIKSSGHGLGYLFAPKKYQPDEKSEHESNDDAPEWVIEAWDYLLRRELKLNTRNPSWLGLPAMMRITMTTPNVMLHNRPDWLAPFNFFLFPIISEVGGYPPGIEKSAFHFIVPFEADRSKWKTLRGINLWDKRVYQITMRPDGKRDTVIPESFGIILRQYLQHPEFKSLAPDGTPCAASTQGLLRRASIIAGEIVFIGKETDRHWEQGGDPSQVDSKVHQFRKNLNMVVTDAADRKTWKKSGIRQIMRKSGFSQKVVYAILVGKPIRKHTLARFKRAMET